MKGVLPLLLLLGLPEAKDQEPLLVVVEASAGEVVEIAALRAAIASELGIHVLSPVADEPPEHVAIMTVVMAPAQAVVVFRRETATVRRSIELPEDERRRLQLVTWLAGNVVRDQTADLLSDREIAPPSEASRGSAEERADAPAAKPEGSTEEPAEALPSPPPTPPASMASPTPVSEPTPSAPMASAPVTEPTPPAPIATTALPHTAAGRTAWTVAALIGQGFLDSDQLKCNCGPIWSTDVGEQSELEVTRSGPSFAFGGTLIKARGHAGGLTLGWHRQLRPWLTPEVGATAGLWSMEGMDFADNVDLFIRLTAGVAFSPTSWLDILARLSLTGPMGRDRYFVHAAAGLRYRLPL